MEQTRNKLSKIGLAAAAGLGLFVVITASRKHILRYINANLSRKRIEVIQKADDCQRVVLQLQKHCKELKVLGFDCEWVTVGGTRRPTALLQLSSGDGLCVLFRLCCMKQIPKSLRDLLEDDSIVKVGVAPQADAKKLSHDYGVGVASTLDLRFLAVLAGKKPEGLAKMSKSILDIELDKHWRLVCSDWEAKELGQKQLEYAANDAFVAVEIFKKLYKDIVPRRFWERNLNYECIRSKLEVFYEVNFKDGMVTDLNKGEKNKIVAFSKFRHGDINIKKIQSRGVSTRSKTLYDNCLLEAPDGDLLCTIDKRKAQWYLNHSLGVEVVSEPFTVRLNFEPAGRAVGEIGKYYQSPKENQCVVCGKKDSFIRKNVIPREYRKYFPDVMKSHNSHDVLLLCPPCHQLSNISDLKVRHKLCRMCNAPITNEDGALLSKEIPALRELKSAARALMKYKNQIPEKRRKSLESVVLKHFREETAISYDLLLEASEIDIKGNNNYSKHGETVVQRFQTEYGGLLELERIWREHFINTMQPKYLPSLWNINHNAKRLQIRANDGRLNQEDIIAAGVNFV